MRSGSRTLAQGVLVAALMAGGAARAQGLSAYSEVGYTESDTRTESQGSPETRSEQQSLRQRYRLSLDRALFPYVRVTAGGVFTWDRYWWSAADQTTLADLRSTTGYGSLSLGNPTLNGTASYQRREQVQRSSGSDWLTLTNDTAVAFAAWRPLDLPTLDFRVSRLNTWDPSRARTDTTTDSMLVAARYAPTRPLQVDYSLTWANPQDHITRSESLELLNRGRVTYRDALLDGRATVYTSYALSHRIFEARSDSGSGFVTQQRFPLFGYSLVEAPPATPDRDELLRNPSVIDGDLTTATTIDLGTSRSVSTDNRLRDVGAEFGEPLPSINLLYLWVDRQLPEAVWRSLTFEVYQSEDNQAWTRVDLAAAVQFAPFENRFELRIPIVAPRFLKVVVRPVQQSVTTDPQHASIFVTELQTFLEQSAVELRGKTTTVAGVFNGSGRYLRVFGIPDLAYDGQVQLNHATDQDGIYYILTNGLAYARRLSQVWSVQARGTRQDRNPGQSHEGGFSYTAGLSATPVPAVLATGTFSGSAVWRKAGRTLQNGVGLYAQLTPYTGIDVGVNAGYTVAQNERSRTTDTGTVGVTAGVSPHPTTTLGGAYFRSRSVQSGGGGGTVTTEGERYDATGSWSPLPALQLSGGVSRITKGERPTTLASFGGNLSMFPGGTLVLRFSHSESLDTAADGVTRSTTPSLRWNIRAGWALDLAYLYLVTRAATDETRASTLSAVLSASLL